MIHAILSEGIPTETKHEFFVQIWLGIPRYRICVRSLLNLCMLQQDAALHLGSLPDTCSRIFGPEPQFSEVPGFSAFAVSSLVVEILLSDLLRRELVSTHQELYHA